MAKKRTFFKAVQKRIDLKETNATEKADIQGIKKQHLKSKNICRVTFRLPMRAAPTAKKVSLVGEFNNWNKETHVMKKISRGDFTATLELELGKEYQFRYFIDNSKWENDANADKYVPTPFGSINSVVIL